VAVRMSDRIAEERVAPFDRTRNGLGVRIQEQLSRVEPMTLGRIIGAVRAIAVELSRPGFRQIDMPNLRGLFGHPNLRRRAALVWSLKRAEFDPRSVFRGQSEVYPGPRRGNA